jgi:diguanylate cyclase (GGDEF)-like protein
MSAHHRSPDPRILVVDDDPEVRHLLVETLSQRHYQVLEARSGHEALAILAARDDVDLMLLDLNLPGKNGYDVLRELKASAHAPDLPVIFLSAQATVRSKVQGLELGAVDYVGKPFELAELVARVAGALRAKATLDRLRSRSYEFERLSFTDPLTGLFNRRYLENRLQQEVSRARRDRSWLSCLMLDVDHFKAVNDRYGHPAGDAVLQGVARALQAGVRNFDTVTRYGGEEFAVILPGADLEGACVAAEGLRQAVGGLRIGVDGVPNSVAVTISVGVASFHGAAVGEPALVERSDAALLEAKRAGRNRVVGVDENPGPRATVRGAR